MNPQQKQWRSKIYSQLEMSITISPTVHISQDQGQYSLYYINVAALVQLESLDFACLPTYRSKVTDFQRRKFKVRRSQSKNYTRGHDVA